MNRRSAIGGLLGGLGSLFGLGCATPEHKRFSEDGPKLVAGTQELTPTPPNYTPCDAKRLDGYDKSKLQVYGHDKNGEAKWFTAAGC